PREPPALAERLVGKGRVILFTTPLDYSLADPKRKTQWTTYWQGESFSFPLALIDRVRRWLSGEEAPPPLAFPCGREVALRVPSPPRPPYALSGAGLGGAERDLRVPAADGELRIPQARLPGNYTVADGKGQVVAGFSLDVAPREGRLVPVPDEELE